MVAPLAAAPLSVGTSGAARSTAPAFRQALAQAPRAASRAELGRIGVVAPKPVSAPVPQKVALPSRSAAPAVERVGAVAREVEAAQSRLDALLGQAAQGRTFSPAELLALQTTAYRTGQVLDLAGKVVDKAAGGVKQTLQTQV